MIENSESVFGMKILQKNNDNKKIKKTETPPSEARRSIYITKQLIKQAIRNHKEIGTTTQSDLTNCIKRLTTR